MMSNSAVYPQPMPVRWYDGLVWPGEQAFLNLHTDEDLRLADAVGRDGVFALAFTSTQQLVNYVLVSERPCAVIPL